jgi:hypothetical protein
VGRRKLNAFLGGKPTGVILCGIRLIIKIQFGVNRFLLYSVIQGVMWPSVYVNVQEGKVAI